MAQAARAVQTSQHPARVVLPQEPVRPSAALVGRIRSPQGTVERLREHLRPARAVLQV